LSKLLSSEEWFGKLFSLVSAVRVALVWLKALVPVVAIIPSAEFFKKPAVVQLEIQETNIFFPVSRETASHICRRYLRRKEKEKFTGKSASEALLLEFQISGGCRALSRASLEVRNTAPTRVITYSVLLLYTI
jgi:hypothetical protein